MANEQLSPGKKLTDTTSFRDPSSYRESGGRTLFETLGDSFVGDNSQLNKFPSLNSNSKTPNFPNKLPRRTNSFSFPNDLIANGRNFYTQIQFVSYAVAQQINFFGAFALPVGGINLPIPMKLNENFVLNWEEFSITNTFFGDVASSPLVSLGSIATGQALNPLVFLQFKRPMFKQFVLSWQLAPRTLAESATLRQIISLCKRAAAPSNNGLLLGYPDVALIRIAPNSVFGNMLFKPCVIEFVSVDYSGGPTPSFFNNGAPTVVTLSLGLKEMQFWYKNEII